MKTMITVNELYALQGKGSAIKLIDTLPGEYFDACHIPGACNACVYYQGEP
jgi:hypothetical protein